MGFYRFLSVHIKMFLRAAETFKRKGVGQTDLFRIIKSSSVTLKEQAMKARESISVISSFNKAFKPIYNTGIDLN